MKKEEPKVTVVTVTFNLIKDGREKFFRQCVESVHNQTYKNIEHIIQDGASTDGTIDLIKEYADKGWCKLFCEKDKGINDAYNKAIKNSSGKYVFFMNSDDYYFDENAIENCVSRMEKENADYCYGEEKRFERDGKFISKWSPKPEVFWITMPWSHQTMGVKLNVLKKIGNYADELSFGADFPLIQQLILNDYKGVEIPEVISAYRIGGISSAKGDLLKNYQTIFVMSKNLMIPWVAQNAHLTHLDARHGSLDDRSDHLYHLPLHVNRSRIRNRLVEDFCYIVKCRSGHANFSSFNPQL